MNSYDLDGRVAMVTGGSSGLGAAAAEALVAAGAAVTVFDLSRPAGDVGWFEGDVTDATALAAAVVEIEQRHGALDVLVHSAGIPGPWQSALRLSEEDWRRVLEVNATGAFLAAKAVLPGMVGRGYGRLVFISSIAGREGNPLLPAYASSKAAVIALVKSLGRDLAGTGVLVNAVTPAAFATPMSLDQPEEIQAGMKAAIPLGRLGEPRELGALVAWLAGEDCSFSTGAVFDLSGGRGVA
ncbi:MAG: SDR family NAD(P)-dependent oxidoreductase [Solirubrobacterales bacterium]